MGRKGITEPQNSRTGKGSNVTLQGVWGEMRGVYDGPYTEVGAYELVEFTAMATH